MLRVCLLLTFLASNAMAQDFLTLDLDERPLRGGMERGIPGLNPGVRANSPYFYFVAVYNRSTIDWTLPTHVIVTGHGGKAGTLFQNASAARAKKYAEVFPRHQILLITVNELDGEQNARKLESWGFQIMQMRRYMLSVDSLLNEVKNLRQLVSLDVYSHANEAHGAALDADYLSPSSYQTRVLKRKFTADGWAVIHGCNSGWRLAPALAGMWGVPVAGSFTGTHFQRLHSVGDFYPYDTELAPPGPFAAFNPFSFDQTVTCAAGGCMRMHPDPYRYWGEWGIAAHGLGFLKFFCGPVRTADCERRMALSLYGYIGKANLKYGAPDADFMQILKEYMCPIHKDNPVRINCDQGIGQALASNDDTYTPFLGKSSVCNDKLCWEPQGGEVSREFMLAVKAFMRGQALLAKELGRGHYEGRVLAKEHAPHTARSPQFHFAPAGIEPDGPGPRSHGSNR